MYILHKYLIREILKHFGTIMIAVVGIYLMVDFFEKIDNFMDAGASLTTALQFILFKTPFVVAQILPVGILLSTLITLGLMNKYNEIIALKSGGVGIYPLFKPIAVFGLIIGIFLFFLSEAIVPITKARADDIFLTKGRKDSALTTQGTNIWIKGKHSITHITHYNLMDSTVFGVTIHQFNDDFKLIRRVDASSGVFKNGEWILQGIMEQRINTDTNELAVSFYDQKAESVTLLPEDLKRVAKNSERMSYEELRNYIGSIEAEGYDARTYRVDLHAKTALPFVCLIMAMIGTGIAVREKFKGSLALVIACGIGIIFLYWVIFSFCVSLGYGGILPPVIAAWLSNFLFLCFGGIVLLDAE
jgi:lipopolysaccharide export system permease protein